ncbi:hypothetical protein [Vibrio algarum]|uniref:YtxH domain-containing protein n=1 Tax=Vibrio algarum TaxID=3020714 RepID=A0ABT4YRL9_9VIBR|nr:hypothetical protein [Vibrio sp. KJ40-1]MDB1124186.1 hypothetical protein [Vibrio sp. KJ40-1]
MFKFLLLTVLVVGIVIGIFLGMNYNDQIEDILGSDIVEYIQEKTEDGSDVVIEKLEEMRG